jgi:ribosomal protein S27E
MVSTQATMDGRQGCAVTGLQHRYARHKPEQTPLYPIIEAHAHRFFAELREQGASLPSFVQAEFDHYLRCGRLEEGFLRVKCTDCRHEHLVAFSCKGRGWCPSCGARRMVETAAHLVDHVFPQVPVRQWVLSFPWPLRLLFAARPDLLTRVLGVVTRALSTAVIKRAGASRSAGAQSGMVTFIQRFGSALNLNVLCEATH